MTEHDYSIQYGRFHSKSPEHAEEMAEYLMKELAPLLPCERSSRIVDVGCGYGFALRALRKLGFENVQGVETSIQQADQARRGGLNVEVSDDTPGWLTARPSQFSVVILRDVLEHVPVARQITLLRSIYRALAPDGRVIVQVPNANAILAARWRYNDFTHYSSFTEHSLFFALRNAGFGDIEIYANKGTVRPSLRLWRKEVRASFGPSLRRYLVRWCWLQVFKAELPFDRLEDISFDLNLKAIAFRRG